MRCRPQITPLADICAGPICTKNLDQRRDKPLLGPVMDLWQTHHRSADIRITESKKRYKAPKADRVRNTADSDKWQSIEVLEPVLTDFVWEEEGVKNGGFRIAVKHSSLSVMMTYPKCGFLMSRLLLSDAGWLRQTPP